MCTASTPSLRTICKPWNLPMLPSSVVEEVMAQRYRLRMGMAVMVGSGMLAVSDNE
jgi:hypothetical protein